MSLRRCVLAILLVPLACSAASKEIVELQRDVALLQDQVRTLQRSVDELRVLVQQNLDQSNKVNTAVAVLDASLRDRLKEQDKVVVAPIAALGSKVEQMSTDFQGVRESVADMTARMGKLQQQIVDLANTVKVMQAPPAPPPGPAGSPAAGSPPMPAETLYANAMRDKSGGRMDLALQGFQDYIKYYGNTDLAPNAQFYIGEIHYSQADFESALAEFDAVLEKYPENNKTPDALYMKGLTLVKLGRKTEGAREFRDLLQRYPDSDLATKAKSQLKSLGLSTAAPKPARRRTTR